MLIGLQIPMRQNLLVTHGGDAATWKSAKRIIFAKSTGELEFIAIKLGGNETKWLRNIFADIPLGMKPTPFVSMHCDC